jgi:hypothetical protein
MKVEPHMFLASVLVGGELSAAYPLCFAFEEGAFKYALNREKL